MSQRDSKSFKHSSLYSKWNSKSPKIHEVLRGPTGRHCSAARTAIRSHPALATRTSCLFRLTRLPPSLALALASTPPGMVFPFGFARLASSSPSSIVQMSASQWGLSTLLPLLNLAPVLFLSFSAFAGFACVCMHTQSCPALCDPWTVACQPPLLTEFPRKNTGVGCRFPLQGIVPAQGWNSGVLHLLQWQADSLPPSHLPLIGFISF